MKVTQMRRNNDFNALCAVLILLTRCQSYDWQRDRRGLPGANAIYWFQLGRLCHFWRCNRLLLPSGALSQTGSGLGFEFQVWKHFSCQYLLPFKNISSTKLLRSSFLNPPQRSCGQNNWRRFWLQVQLWFHVWRVPGTGEHSRWKNATFSSSRTICAA